MATFVLVSGACHASWCWERIVPLLERDGHTVVAPELIGMGSDNTLVSSVTVADWGDQVTDIICDQNESVILVGHSRGGIIISDVGEKVPERIAMLVYLTAFLLKDGDTITNALARVPPRYKGQIMDMAPDNTVTISKEALQSALYNTTSQEWQERAAGRVRPEPLSALTSAVHVSDERFGVIPRAYIECTEDMAIPLELQRSFQADLPCKRVLTLESDHSPFYSAPQLLAGALSALASKD